MKYYLIQRDPNYPNAADVINWYGVIDKRKITLEDYWRLEEMKTFFVSDGMFTVFTDVLTYPFLMFTKKSRQVLYFYDRTIPFKQVILIDRENHRSKIYNLPILEKIDCLAEGTVFNLDKSMVKKCVIDPEKTQDKCIFWLAGVFDTHTVIRCDLAESLLSRNVKGLGLIPIDMIEKRSVPVL